ncbi:alpha/beta hydrolase [Marinitenerispora sediminis]|uniref:alpha/beta hydrolase n=1 Tax=Marinitenerispora sediminis TaxID=1931232 RepID=UPI0018F2574A|nr:alpha/beta hydrolase [Marinitenerispora sediminis]
MTDELLPNARTGVAAGVPYVALPPAGGARSAPLVAVWHMMDAPRTETAMAAALPLAELAAWRVYLGLPMHGSRQPAGEAGPDDAAFPDPLLDIVAPVVRGAAAEFPAALAELRTVLPVTDGPVGLVGASAGAAVALEVLAAGAIPVAAAALVNPAVTARAVIGVGERAFGMRYPWTEESRAVADRLDFVARAGEIARHHPEAPCCWSAERTTPRSSGPTSRRSPTPWRGSAPPRTPSGWWRFPGSPTRSPRSRVWPLLPPSRPRHGSTRPSPSG